MSDPTPDLDVFTDAQRRRAEALILVAVLFPVWPHSYQRDLARWITTGRTA